MPRERARLAAGATGGRARVVAACATCAACLAAVAGLAAAAGASPAVRLDHPRPDSLMSVPFEVVAPLEVRVEAVGLLPRLSSEYAAAAWILDTASRRPVWSLAGKERESTAESRYLRRADDRLRLPPGRYALYFFAAANWRENAAPGEGRNLLNSIADLISGENPRRDLPQYLAACHATVTPLSGPADALRPLPAPPSSGAEAPLVDLTRAQCDSVLVRAFRVLRPVTLRARACVETGRDSTRLLDIAWIEDAATAEAVWSVEPAATRPAGGSRRNRLCEDEVRLAPGDYVARFAGDDSHGWGCWNALPPPDPDAWGLALYAGPGATPADVSPLRLEEVRRPSDLLASLNMARDDDHRRAEFRLARTARVRIDAMGEGMGRDMDDVGWIVDLATGNRVWELEKGLTEHAGGAEKNRRFTGELELPAGRYEAHFRCDGSHAFGDWNAAPPAQQWRWGMTVRVARPGDGAGR